MGFDLTEYASTPLGRLAFHQTGSGEPVILHHGGESHKGQYEIFAPHLADGIRAISYDQRDIGDSFRAAGPYGLKALADDCAALMDALGLDKAHIAGISFGGVVSLHMAIHHPDRVQTLIVGAAPPAMRASAPFLQKMAARSPEERNDLMIEALLSPQAQLDHELTATVREVLSVTYSRPGSHRLESLRDHDLDAELAAIGVPTLLIYGSDDPICPPAAGQFIADRITGAELVVLDGARHGLSFEFRAQTAALMSDFVLSHRTRA
ncbi:MAG TPA: alpha/beta fold hydrolase [Trebonia sp.]|nr:alpha/beta fold hydrolase [Trebonia sp.]